MKKRINVAILGAAGVLGQRFIDRLENHPTFEIVALADVMVGKRYEDATKWRLGIRMPSKVKDMKIAAGDSFSRNEIDVVFSALPGGIAGKIELDLAKKRVLHNQQSKRPPDGGRRPTDYPRSQRRTSLFD